MCVRVCVFSPLGEFGLQISCVVVVVVVVVGFALVCVFLRLFMTFLRYAYYTK